MSQSTDEDRLPGSRLVTPGRYTETASGDVFDHWGGHYISKDLWARWMREGRGDRERHCFEALPIVEHLGQGHYLTQVRCIKCGEKRSVGMPVEELNRTERWCTVPPTLWQRLRASARHTLPSRGLG